MFLAFTMHPLSILAIGFVGLWKTIESGKLKPYYLLVLLGFVVLYIGKKLFFVNEYDAERMNILHIVSNFQYFNKYAIWKVASHWFFNEMPCFIFSLASSFCNG